MSATGDLWARPAAAQRPADDRSRLVRVAVAGRVAPARITGRSTLLDSDGHYACLPGHGGVVLDVHCGSPVSDRIADHLMVGASVEDAEGLAASLDALQLLSCVGNEVRDAAGRPLGIVAGKRGGSSPGLSAPDLISVEAADARLASLSPGDLVVIEAVGRGLTFPDWPEVVLANTSPRLLDALPIAIDHGRLSVAVVAMVPSWLTGPGVGQDVWIGDIEIAGSSGYEPDVALHFGDLVAFTDLDGRVSRHFQPGFVSIGTVSHGPSPVPGHGIGITILISGATDRLGAYIDAAGSVGATISAWARELES